VRGLCGSSSGHVRVHINEHQLIQQQKLQTRNSSESVVEGQFDVAAALRRHLATPQARGRRHETILTHYRVSVISVSSVVVFLGCSSAGHLATALGMTHAARIGRSNEPAAQ